MSRGNRSFRLKVIVAFALVYVFWGSTYLGIGIAVQYVSALVMSGRRFTIAGAVLLLWCALRGRRVRLRMQEFLRLTFLGVVLLSIGNVLLGRRGNLHPNRPGVSAAGHHAALVPASGAPQQPRRTHRQAWPGGNPARACAAWWC